VMDQGFEVHWSAGQGCRLVRPDGVSTVVPLMGYVPVVLSGGDEYPAAAPARKPDAGAADETAAEPLAEDVAEAQPDATAAEPPVADVAESRPEVGAAEPPAAGAAEEKLPDAPQATVPSGRHLLCHVPHDPSCWHCVEAKMRAKPARRRDPALKKKPEKFGELVYADHLILNEDEEGAKGERSAVVLLDWATGCGDMVSVTTKASSYAENAIRHFVGPRDVLKELYTDGSPELEKTAQGLKVPHGVATPYRPQSNTHIENFVGQVVRGARATLLHSGLPHTFWTYAGRTWNVHRNVLPGARGEKSLHEVRHGKAYDGPLIPFGAEVIFKPPKAKLKPRKFEPSGQRGTFLG